MKRQQFTVEGLPPHLDDRPVTLKRYPDGDGKDPRTVVREEPAA